jgi:hypothetical protein
VQNVCLFLSLYPVSQFLPLALFVPLRSSLSHCLVAVIAMAFSSSRHPSRCNCANVRYNPSHPHSPFVESSVCLSWSLSQLLRRNSSFFLISPSASQSYYVNVRVSLSLPFIHLLSLSRFTTYLNFNACVYKYTCSMCGGNAAVQDAPKINSTKAINCFWTLGT